MPKTVPPHARRGEATDAPGGAGGRRWTAGLRPGVVRAHARIDTATANLLIMVEFKNLITPPTLMGLGKTMSHIALAAGRVGPAGRSWPRPAEHESRCVRHRGAHRVHRGAHRV